MSTHRSHRIRAGGLASISLTIVIAAGFCSKFYSGPAEKWVNDSLSGAFYEAFWCLLLFLFVRGARPWKIALAVLAATCLLEILQLSSHPALEYIRRYFLGRALIGTTFVWSDFIYYAFGCAASYLWMVFLRRRSQRDIPNAKGRRHGILDDRGLP